MNRRLTPAAMALLLGTLASPGHTDPQHRLTPERDHHGRVLQVKPLYETVPVADDGRQGHRCESLARTETREERVGYRVKYRYRGQVYHTQTAHDPGERIRVDGGLRPMRF